MEMVDRKFKAKICLDIKSRMRDEYRKEVIIVYMMIKAVSVEFSQKNTGSEREKLSTTQNFPSWASALLLQWGRT